MCDPISGTMFAITAGSQVLNYTQQAGNAAAQNDHNQAVYGRNKEIAAQNRKAALKRFREEIRGTEERIIQENVSAALRSDDATRETRRQLATLKVRTAEAGVSSELDTMASAKGSEAKTRIEMNREAVVGQLKRQLTLLEPEQVLDPMEPPEVEGPSTAALMLGLGGSALGGFTQSSALMGTTLDETGEAFRAGKMFDFSMFTGGGSSAAGPGMPTPLIPKR